MTNEMQVAETIRSQVGGRALFMLGASQFVGSEDSLRFKFAGCKKANVIVIRLAADDTYTVEFWKMGRGALVCKLIHGVEMVYVDQLHRVIESFTGLVTSL